LSISLEISRLDKTIDDLNKVLDAIEHRNDLLLEDAKRELQRNRQVREQVQQDGLLQKMKDL